MSIRFDANHWALVLGGSSGFGLATAQKLAAHGMSVAVVHRDRKGSMPAIDKAFDEIRATGVQLRTWNTDALAEDTRKKVLDELQQHLGAAGRVRLLMHSIAYGNLKLLAPLAPSYGAQARTARARLAERLGVTVETLTRALDELADLPEGAAASTLATPPPYDSESLLEDEDFTRTVHSMGTSLASWAKDVFARKLFADSARILSMTSEGNEVAWRGYAAVSAAKTALEATSRSLALELGPYGVRTNVVQAGVTDTPALRLIPGSSRLKAQAMLRNPLGRLTTPADVAGFIALMCTDEAGWVNGAILRVDGGEHACG
jgi:NAD(P)-dependent dehydrogenase (short-subunit alcohol dehydrogenase family)